MIHVQKLEITQSPAPKLRNEKIKDIKENEVEDILSFKHKEISKNVSGDLEIEHTHIPEHLLENLPPQSREMILSKLLEIDTELARQRKVKEENRRMK